MLFVYVFQGEKSGTPRLFSSSDNFLMYLWSLYHVLCSGHTRPCISLWGGGGKTTYKNTRTGRYQSDIINITNKQRLIGPQSDINWQTNKLRKRKQESTHIRYKIQKSA